MAAGSEERELVKRLKQLSDPSQSAEDVAAGRQQWYASAAQYLQQTGIDHWFCQHGEVARGLAEVLRSGVTKCCLPASLPGLSVLSIDMDGMAVTDALNCSFEDKLVVQRLWTAISEQLQTCSDCVNAYHAAQVTIVILQFG
jgi:hypothetical protein